MNKTFLITLIFLIFTSIPVKSYAFTPNYVISDWELTDPFALDLNQIQYFLQRGFLSNYKTKDWKGKTRYASEIIWRASQENRISPKFLLVLLQKEQSLIEDNNPTDRQLDWATGYAVCDACKKDDPSIQRWKGFGKQINSAASQISSGYLKDIQEKGVTQGKYGPNIPIIIDGTEVVPENSATAALYAYTPHLHGNKIFTEIWDRYFSIQYPSGTLLKGDKSSSIYLIEFGYKKPIKSWSVFTSRFNPNLIIEVPQKIIDRYPIGKEINFTNYSLLKDENENIYLLVDNALRKFDSISTFKKLGFLEDELESISSAEVSNFEKGLDITEITQYPQGTLLQLSTTGSIFYIENGVRHLIVDRAIIKARFKNTPIIVATSTEVEQYKEGDQVTFPDGYLVRSKENPAVYIISEGKRRPIISETIFNSYGYSWKDVLTIDNIALRAHKLGLPIKDPINDTKITTK